MKRLPLIVLAAAVGLAPVRAQNADDRKATVDYLRALQAADGSFGPNRPMSNAPLPTDLRSTSSALRALKHFGGEPKDAKAAAKYVDSCFDKGKGGFGLRPRGEPDVFTTAVGLMAVVELKMPQEPYVEAAVNYLAANAKDFEQIRIAAAGLEAVGKHPKAADAWLEQLAKLRNPDGTYGKEAGVARDTGGAVAAVLRLGGKLEQRDNVVKALTNGQRADGGYGRADTKDSDLETTYRVLRTLHMLKEKPDVAKLRAFIAKCRNDDGGYSVTPGGKSSVGGTYFAGTILHWIDDK
jgi:prenyltransferase beta subunit